MDQSPSFAPELENLLGQNVVVDVAGPFIYIGSLQDLDGNSLTLIEVDVHDLRETTTGTDRYLIDTLKHGIRVNRRRVTIMSRQVISISPLESIVPY